MHQKSAIQNKEWDDHFHFHSLHHLAVNVPVKNQEQPCQ